jgi:hypothetical protein
LGKDARKANVVHGVKLFDVEHRDSFGEIIVHHKLALEVVQLDKTLTAVPGGLQPLHTGTRRGVLPSTIHRSAGHYENQKNH